MTDGLVDLDEARRLRAQNGAGPMFDPWAETVVPLFPLHVLPRTVREFVEVQSRLIGVDPAGLAMATLAALSGAIDHRFAVRLQRHADWQSGPRLWVLLHGAPSTKKTPGIEAPVRELERAQGEAFAAWEAECKPLREAGTKEDELPSRPPRFLVGDVTVEKLCDILRRSGRGVLVKRDELAAWIGSMEKYAGGRGGAADRGFWLEAYNGGPYTSDRVSHGERFVPNLSVSIIGGIQPDRLASMRDLASDGLLQRFLVVVMQPGRRSIDEPAGDVRGAYGRLVRRLLALEPSRLALDDDAYREFNLLLDELADMEAIGGGLAAGFAGFAGKLGGVAGSLALLLHLAADPVHGPFNPVAGDTMRAVRELVGGFLVGHALEFYRTAETATDGDRVQKIASYLLTSGKARVTASDLASNVAPCKGLGLGKITDMVSPLVAAEWLSPNGNDPIARSWNVSPSVGDQFAARRRLEEERKAKLAALMRSTRRPTQG